MKQKKLVVGLLVMLAVVVSTFTFAYWSSVNLTDSVASNSVTIGQGRTATVTAAVGSTGSGTLVPAGLSGDSVSSNPVESLTYTFTIDWADDLYPSGSADLNVLINNVSDATAALYLNFSVSIDNVTYTTASLANVSQDYVGGLTEGSQLTVYVVVTLDEPATQADYDAIKNAAITFDLTFTASNEAA